MGLVVVAVHPSAGTLQRRLERDHDVTVGRAETAELRLSTGSISKHHARFCYRDGRTTVTDLESTNGTYVNGRKISRTTTVVYGDTVELGGWKITVAEADFEPRAPREAELLAALARSPADDEVRQVYGDWLEENGHPVEAELISLEREIRGGGTRIDDRELKRLGYRLQLVAASLPIDWRARVSRPAIEGCESVSFELTCPKTWDSLEPTSDPFVRHCDGCAQPVYFAKTVAAARTHADRGRCIAVDVAQKRQPRDLEAAPWTEETRVSVGRPAPSPPPPPLPVVKKLIDLPFFAKKSPPRGLGPVLHSLAILPPSELTDESVSGGCLRLPEPISDFVARISIPFEFDGVHDGTRRFAFLAHREYSSVEIVFRRDADVIRAWLEARFGAPREIDSVAVYGAHWLFRSEACSLEWVRDLPAWALPERTTELAVAFLSALATELRKGPSHYQVKGLGSRPPPGSGIVVTGPVDGEDFWFRFEPKLAARDLACALDLEPPVGDEPMLEAALGPWVVTATVDGLCVRRPR